MVTWHSLYWPATEPEAVAASLRASALALGYAAFDPFGLIPGRSYPHAVRLFVGPLGGGWVRVVGAADARQLPELARLGPGLALALDGGSASITFWADGAPAEADVCAAWLRPGFALDDVTRILNAADDGPRRVENLPLDVLPDDIQQMASGVDLKQARSMFTRLTGSTLKRAGGEQSADAARALLAAGEPPDWTSGGGARISRLMGCLTVPNDWRTPDFTTLRDAYQLHLRRQRRPNADLYPGDAEAMAAVPNALDYIPVYAGANTAP